jgi:hypothetical protein
VDPRSVLRARDRDGRASAGRRGLDLIEAAAGGAEGGGIFTNTTTFSPPGGAPINIDNWTDHPTEKDLDLNWRRENLPQVPDTGIPDDEARTVDMGAYEAWDPSLIFWDGFESGGTWEWSVVIGEP